MTSSSRPLSYSHLTHTIIHRLAAVRDDTRWEEFEATGSHNTCTVDDGSEFVVLDSTSKNGLTDVFIQGILL
jgi:hypothetical protein